MIISMITIMIQWWYQDPISGKDERGFDKAYWLVYYSVQVSIHILMMIMMMLIVMMVTRMMLMIRVMILALMIIMMKMLDLKIMIVTMMLMILIMMTMMVVILVIQGLAENNQGWWKATCSCGGRETSQEEVANISLEILNCKYLINNIELQISH